MPFVPADVDTANDLVNITAHGLAENDEIEIESDGSVPAPLAESTKYFNRSTDPDEIKFGITSGGTVIDLTTQGTGALNVFRWQTRPGTGASGLTAGSSAPSNTARRPDPSSANIPPPSASSGLSIPSRASAPIRYSSVSTG